MRGNGGRQGRRKWRKRRIHLSSGQTLWRPRDAATREGAGKGALTRGSDHRKPWGPSDRSLVLPEDWEGEAGGSGRDWAAARCLRKARTLLAEGPSPHRGWEGGRAAGTTRGGACGAVRGPEGSLCGPGLPSRRPPAKAPFTLRATASLRRTAVVLPAAPEASKLGGVNEEFPRSHASGVRPWGPDARGLHLCFRKPVGTAGGHLRLKADTGERNCDGGDSAWETFPGPNSAASVRGLSFRVEGLKPTSKEVSRFYLKKMT